MRERPDEPEDRDGSGEDGGFMSAIAFGHSLRGLGVNLLVREIAPMTDFLSGVLGVAIVYADKDFAVLQHG